MTDPATSPEPPPQTEPAAPIPRGRRVALAVGVGAASLAVDLGTKAWAWEHLRNHRPIRVITGLFHFEFSFNTGSAFGLMSQVWWSRPLFIIATFLAVAYLGYLLRTLPTKWPSVFVAIGLVAGGALGNLHDRLFRSMAIFGQGNRHGVVDFIVVFYWPGRRWPAFNVADAVLLVGVFWFVWFVQRHGKALREAAASKA